MAITFRVRLLQVFVSIILVQSLTTFVVFYVQTKKMTLDLSSRISGEMVEKTQEMVTNYLSTPASYTRITAALTEKGSIVENKEELWRFMWQPLLLTPQIESFFIADNDGNYVQVRRTPLFATRIIDRTSLPAVDKRQYRTEDYKITQEEEKVTEWDPRTRPWYLATGSIPKYYWTDAYIGTTSRKPVIGCSYPVLGDNGNLSSVICVNIPLEELSLFLSEQKITSGSHVFIVDEQDQVIAFPDLQQLLLQEEGSEELRLRHFGELELPHLAAIPSEIAAGSGRNFFYKGADENYFVTIQSIFPDLGIRWRIITTIPESELLKDVYTIIRKALVVFASVFLASLFVIFFVSTRITRPIVQLSDKNQRLQNFELDLGDRVSSSILEIRQMSDSLYNAAAGLSAFKKYVPADLVRSLIANGEKVDVGGVMKELTMLFTDIEGFTGISEGLPSDFLMQHLSEYLDRLSGIIMDQQGTIDKYIGDSIMAFWGAPKPNENSEIDACKTALYCQEALEEMNREWTLINKPVFNTRIGIAAGRVIVGNVGSNQRINYSVIGDSVNLASRLEGLNKYYGTKIIISGIVYERVKNSFQCRFLDKVTVAGKNEGMRIYELLDRTENTLSPIKRNFVNWYEKGLHYYFLQEWEQALKYFIGIRKRLDIDDKSVNLFITRCLRYKKGATQLPKDWDGIYRHIGK